MKNLLNYLLGYVTINIKGDGVERFINLAVQRGIRIWDIQWKKDGTVKAQVQLSYIKALRHVARKSRCRFRIVGKTGLPFRIKDMKRRKMMVVGAVMFIAALYVLSSFVFFIEVTSQEPVKSLNPQMVKRLAAEKGVSIGRPKWLMDFKETEKYLMNNIPQLTWVGISAQGTKVEIEIVEKILPGPGEKDKSPGNMVALKNGVITQILVMRGQARVAPGDTVSKGEVLISGLVLPQFENPTLPQPDGHLSQPELVKADGIIRAKVWYRGYGECPVVEKEKKYTGETVRSLSIKWGEKEKVLWGPEKSPYQLSTGKITTKRINLGRGKNSPVEIIMTTHQEQKIYQKNWGEEGAWNQAVQNALMTVKRQVPSQAQIIKQDVRPIEENGDGLKRALVVIETEEEIGKFLPIE
ncbi:MAG: sporulation protein YqfD [Dehalobacterium sp.]